MESTITKTELSFFYKGPITALCFQPATPNNQLRLIASEGPSISVYDLHTKSIIYQATLFPECFKITDLQIFGTHLLVNTEKSLKVYYFKVLRLEDYQVIKEFMKESVDKIIHASLDND